MWASSGACYRFQCGGAQGGQSQDPKQAVIDATSRAAAQAMVTGDKTAGKAALLGIGALLLMDVIDAAQQRAEAERIRQQQLEAQRAAQAARDAETKRQEMAMLTDMRASIGNVTDVAADAAPVQDAPESQPDALPPARQLSAVGTEVAALDASSLDRLPAASSGTVSGGGSCFFGLGNCNVSATGEGFGPGHDVKADTVPSIVQKVKTGTGPVCVDFDGSESGKTCVTPRAVPTVGTPEGNSRQRVTRQQYDQLKTDYQEKLKQQQAGAKAAAEAAAEAKRSQKALAAARDAEARAKAQAELEKAEKAAEEARQNAEKAKKDAEAAQIKVQGADVYDEGPQPVKKSEGGAK